ncbi:flagellin [Caldovatus aquaticus]|uniref:Flagellin C-terminal domain-containing protein n=1 Tax=Caldovatus aquaticus TaxID=2865671 RepID=A0ABS7F494_9PROT|nr:flagellin [Caldovatus aquaticus]MBW8270440.1 hypothetical protein [Caldovatus aquaticus]
MTATIGALGVLAAETARLRARMDVLARQAADGRRGGLYGDIAPEARRAMDLRGEIARRAAYEGAIGGALGRAAAAQEVLGRLGQIAETFFAETVPLASGQPERIATVASRAREAMAEVAALLNERHGGEYLFGGGDLENPPVPDPEGIATSGMALQIAAAVAGLGGGNAAAVAAATKAAALDDTPGVTPFSAYLSDPLRGGAEAPRGLVAADGERVEYGLFANRNARAVSAGETTGSWARDLLRGLATLAALDPAQAQLGADFTALVGTVREGLRSAVRGLNAEAGLLGAAEARLEAIRTRHAEVSVALRSQLSAIEEVDMAETITRLQATRTQLEASYQAIAALGALSLARFLGG